MNSVTKEAWKAILRLIAGAVVAAIVMYAFGWLYRELIPSKVLLSPHDEEAFVRFLQTHFPASGTYTLPGPGDNDEATRELVETGPVATLNILSKRDISLKDKTAPVRVLQTFVTAFLIGLVLRKARPALNAYGSRVIFVALIGLAAAVYNDLADPVWLYHPWRWSLAKAAFHLVSWTAAGLILARDELIGFVTDTQMPQTQARTSDLSAGDLPR